MLIHPRFAEGVLLGVIALALGLAPASSQAQVDALRQGWQSPEAAALGQYGDVPVGYETGMPKIEVPLYELTGPSLSLPVKLAYHASGVKVNTVPSWVGLGWALQAGGVITRQVRGLPDDGAGGYIRTGGLLYEAANWPYTPKPYVNPNTDVGTYLYRYHTGAADSEPDLYFFNVAGRSGKFVYGPDGANAAPEAHLMPYQNLRIEPTSTAPIQTWTITDENGTRYIFSAAEETDEASYVSGGSATGAERRYVSAWHLTEIRSASGEEVIQLHYSHLRTIQRREKTVEREVIYHGLCFLGSRDQVGGKQRHYTDLNLNVHTPYLDRIEAPGGTMHFDYDTETRRDRPFGAEGLPLLEAIRVDGPTGTPLKRFRLEYGYFREDSDQARRLKLQSVEEIGQDGTPLGGRYRFQYIESPRLPPFGSHKRDHWGYYNGAGNDNTALPEMTVKGERLEGADRRPSGRHMVAGLLKHMAYPTGGYTLFDYEPHDYSRVAGSRWGDIRKEWIVERDDISLVGEVGRGGDDHFYPGDEIVREIGLRSLGSSVLEVDVWWPTEESSGGRGLQIAGNPRMEIRKPGTTEPVRSITPEGVDLTNPVSTAVWRLRPGTYQVVLTGVSVCASGCDLDFFDVEAFTVSLTWPKHVEVEQAKRRIGGGVRISRIRSYDGRGERPDRVQRFVYRSRSDAERSSGMLIRAPVYRHEVRLDHCYYTERSTNARVPLGATGGAAVGYSRVQVLYGEDGQHGEKHYRYRLSPDTYDLAAGWTSFRHPTSHDWHRGLHQETQVRKAEDASQGTLVQKQTVHREVVGDNPSESHPLVTRLRARSMQSAQTLFGHSDYPYDTRQYYEEASYYIVAGWHHPTQRTVTTYDPATGDSSTTTTTYQYEEQASSSALGQMRSEARTTSTGRKRTRRFEYAHERHAPGMGPDGAHQLSQKYSVMVEDSAGTALSKRWTTWDNPDGYYRPHEEHVWGGTDGSAPSSARDPEVLLQKAYIRYNAYGQPRTVEDARGQTLSYVYDGPGGRLSKAATTVGGRTLEVNYAYNARGLLSGVTDENERATTYRYDAFGRLAEVRDDAGALVRQIDYHFGDPSAGDPSYVRSTRFGGPGSSNQVETTYFDGLGRPFQSQASLEGGAAVLEQTSYDASGRLFRQWRPVKIAIEE